MPSPQKVNSTKVESPNIASFCLPSNSVSFCLPLTLYPSVCSPNIMSVCLLEKVNSRKVEPLTLYPSAWSPNQCQVDTSCSINICWTNKPSEHLMSCIPHPFWGQKEKLKPPQIVQLTEKPFNRRLLMPDEISGTALWTTAEDTYCKRTTLVSKDKCKTEDSGFPSTNIALTGFPLQVGVLKRHGRRHCWPALHLRSSGALTGFVLLILTRASLCGCLPFVLRILILFKSRH